MVSSCVVRAECHKAKNLVPDAGGRPTKVGEKVLLLQRMLPNARVVYCSATGGFANTLTQPYVPTKVGEKVLILQRMLPNARVVYYSATGAPALCLSYYQKPSSLPACLLA